MSALSIGIVCFPSFGGSGVVGAELAMGLAARGHRVHLISTEPPSRIVDPPPDLTLHPVRVPRYPLFEHPPYDLAVASAIFEACERHRLDLVQVHYAVPHSASGVLARHLLGAAGPRLVTSLHGTDVTHTGPDPSYRAITAAAIRASDGITVPSAWLRDEALRRLDLEGAAPIEVIPNFVDPDRFAPPPVRDRLVLRRHFPAAADDGPVLFHVSNFRPVKRTLDLVEILSLLRRDLPSVRLLLGGDGPDRPLVEARVHELGLCGSVRFLGEQVDFAADLRHADAFVLPSESESFGLAALEALSAGVPVFGYRVGGLPEVVGADAGDLVKPFDVAALARAILPALLDPAVRDSLGRAARAHVMERFRLDPAIDRYEAYFRRVVAGQRHTERR